jgi:hypothetical protein
VAETARSGDAAARVGAQHFRGRFPIQNAALPIAGDPLLRAVTCAVVVRPARHVAARVARNGRSEAASRSKQHSDATEA